MQVIGLNNFFELILNFLVVPLCAGIL